MLYLLHNIQICRCERSEYDKFESLHYLRGICKGAICFQFKVDGEISAFASLLAMPMKNHTDALIFHRIVVLEQYQNLGLSSLIINLLGGIYQNNGKSVYIKTDSSKMGKMLRHNNQWAATQMNQRTRKLTKQDHERNKARHRRAAYCYKFVGDSIMGYDLLTQPINEIRSQRLINRYFEVDTFQIAKSIYKISNPEFLKDAITLDLDTLSSKYGVSFSKESNAKSLYSTEYVIRRKNMDGSLAYSKRLLFLNGIILRLQREMTVEGMIYHLLREKRIQSLKNGNIEVIKVAMRVNSTDISKFAHLKSQMPKYRVNKDVALEQGLSPKQASNIARKEIRATRIAELFNPELSDDENLRHMADNGLVISISTLKRWRKYNGFTRYNKSIIPTT